MIEYVVDGTARSIDLTMETPAGTEQYASIFIPIKGADGGPPSYFFSRGDFVYLSAQNTGETGTVHCMIRGSDGTVISEATSHGAYTIATCDGTAE